MKNKNQKSKKRKYTTKKMRVKKGILIGALFLMAAYFSIVGIYRIGSVVYSSAYKYLFDWSDFEALAAVNIPVPKPKDGVYNYNAEVPVETIKKEIIKQAQDFKLNENTMIRLADCESELNNLAKNKISTAKGVYQFIASTWDNTMSGKKKISPYDYKANIREALLLYSLGKGRYEWRDCYKKLNLTD